MSLFLCISSQGFAQNSEFLQHWQPLPSYQINHIQAHSPCSLYYDITNHPWPNNIAVVHIELSAFQNQTSSFWILVAQQPSTSTFQIEAIPAFGYNSFQMDNQISATAYVANSGGCLCESLFELEEEIMYDDNHGNLSFPPVAALTYYLVRVTVTNKVEKVAFRSKPASGDIKFDCIGRRDTVDPNEIIEWTDDNSVSIFFPNLPCEQAIAICGSNQMDVSIPGAETGTIVSHWYKINYNGGDLPAISFSSEMSQNYFGANTTPFVNLSVVLYEVPESCGNPCGELGEGVTSSTNSSSWNMPSNWITNPGIYLMYVEFELSATNQQVVLDYENINCEYTYPSPEICEACLPQFVPEAGKRFVLSAWVKEENANLSTLDYSNSYLQVSFIGSTTAPVTFYPEGQIIDGWQRIEGIINFPSDAVSIQIDPGVTSGVSYFDDLRFFPYDGSMKSYVYDPVKLRFIAELDERNYATFYEYDEEGKLTRIKKETERGILTIQESKSSNVKKP